MRALAPLLLLLTVLLAPGDGALAAPHHQAGESMPAAEDCPRHASSERERQDQEQMEHRSCCHVGCSMTAMLRLPPVPALPVLTGRHELPPPATAPPTHQSDTLFRPPR